MPSPMTKSPRALAEAAFQTARKALAPYSSKFSRHDFTRAQFFAILTLKAFFQTDYRGIVQILRDFSDLRRILKLEKVPHWTTVQKAEARLLKKGLLTFSNMPPSDLRNASSFLAPVPAPSSMPPASSPTT